MLNNASCSQSACLRSSLRTWVQCTSPPFDPSNHTEFPFPPSWLLVFHEQYTHSSPESAPCPPSTLHLSSFLSISAAFPPSFLHLEVWDWINEEEECRVGLYTWFYSTSSRIRRKLLTRKDVISKWVIQFSHFRNVLPTSFLCICLFL